MASLPVFLRAAAAAALALFLLVFGAPPPAHAASDPFIGALPPGGAGIGLLWRIEESPYRGGGHRRDFVPLYLYEGEYAYLHAYRVGIKLEGERLRFDGFLKRGFEGYPAEPMPSSLSGMRRRESGVDAGASVIAFGPWGAAYVEAMRDISDNSHGNEIRLGVAGERHLGRLRVRPYALLAWRDRKLNDYYYGVSPAEATPERPAYSVGGGMDAELGIYGAYAITGAWSVVGGISATRRAQTVRDSPIVEPHVQKAAMLGLLYDFAPADERWVHSAPLIARLYYGASSDCDMLQVMRLACTSTHTQDQTSIAGFGLGRPFIQGLNGWPLDIAGFVGLVRHKERGSQEDFWQVHAYLKAYYYGFPWSERIRTRFGFGAGLSYVNSVPLMEVRDQALRGRDTSRLLNFLEPTVDVSMGDLLGVRSLRDTYAGLGVSHRSGIFGSSRLLGNVNGGSNYIYGYLETSF